MYTTVKSVHNLRDSRDYALCNIKHTVYDVLSYQLKLIKMRAELSTLDPCAVPF